MPELAEVFRIVHFIRQHLVGKTLTKVSAQEDPIIYGKVGTSAAEFQKAMEGKKVVGAGQQGKYFWIAMSSPPHPVMHFGMAGWLKIRDADTYYYRTDKPEDKEWPPKYWKFLLETDGEPKTEAAFVDFRRLGRIRLVDCPADDIRNHTPLKENGPDPVVDKDIVTETWLANKLRSKKVPIKALLLDQANISGIEKFPEHWLFKHRWSKGKKNVASALPNGDKITFITVGGRTSAVVPNVQKKTGPVAKDVNGNDTNGTDSGTKRKRAPAPKEESDEETKPKKATGKPQAKPATTPVKEEHDEGKGRRRSMRNKK
ncbi:hypothetical protein ATERTT37_005518 [Aspergillus terreus]